MRKLINTMKSYRKILHARNRDRLWNKLTKEQQSELMMQKINGTLWN